MVSKTKKSSSFQSAKGPIPYNMTNDYVFRIVLQQDLDARNGLIGSLLHMKPEEILHTTVLNPIDPGKSVRDKEIRMDVRVELMDHAFIDLEMQTTTDHGNWISRSLTYLCREYDSLEHGDDYKNAYPVYQFAFLDFTLFKDHPEFYATYRMRNVRDGYSYSDKLSLCVIELNHIDLATEEDRRYGIDQWARLFKATTWEEMKMIAHGNAAMISASETIYLSNEDYNILKVARERADFLREQAYIAKHTKELEQELSEKNAEIDNQKAEIAEKDAKLDSQKAEIVEKDAEIESQKAEIECLRAEIAGMKSGS